MTACLSCAAELPEGSRFCLSCGARLAAPAAAAEERKIVTTLFCDLVAFTAMSEAADPEDVDALLRSYHAAARKVIESHGGAVEKFIGDAVVGVFGVPAAHEDDPERAVRAGLRIVQALEGMTRPDGSPLQVRVGVNTGEALVRLDVTPGSGEGFLTGDAVNTAARLQAAAPPGGVAVGAATHSLSASVIVYEQLPPVVAKGKRESVRVWLATRARGRTGLRTGGATTTPFLGRADELSTLLETLDAAIASRQARFVLIVGEPGIGKSRLVLELARSLDERPDPVTWRQGRCLPYGEGVTFWALSDIVKAHAGVFDWDDGATVAAKLDEMLPEDEDRPWLLRRLRPLVGLDASQASREESFAAWTRVLEMIASDGPTAIVIEDLHWAGEAMRDFVDHLLCMDLRVPLLLVGTTRPELLQQHEGPLTSATENRRLRRITLPALSLEEAGALVTALLDGEPATATGSRIVDLVGGNPLFAEQYVRLLLDRGLLVPTADGLLLHPAADLPLPETVQAVLAARLDTLPPPHKALLCDAAVIGETFWLGAVAALSGQELSAVDEAMVALAARDLVRPVIALSMEGEPERLFWHALARDVAYGQLPRKARARKHKAAAMWIERRAGEQRDEFAEILVYHYTTALDLARATGDEELASSLVAPAIDCLSRAGDRALRLDAAAAERHFARGLQLAGPDRNVRLRLLPGWAEALFLRNRFRDSAAAYEEAIAGHEACGDIRGAAVAMCRLAIARSSLGELAGDLTRAAVDLLAGDDPSQEQAEVLGHYAVSLGLLNDDPRSVIEAAAQAVEICDVLALPEPALAMSMLGVARLDLGDLGGLEDYERALAAARAQGLGIERATIEFNYLSPVLLTRGARATHDATAEGLDFSRRHGLEAYVLAYRVGLVESLEQTGEWERALAEAADLLPALEESEDVWDLVSLRSLQALILSWRGRPVEAEPFVDWLVTRGDHSEVGWTMAAALLAASVVRLHLGDTCAALGLLARCLATPRAVGSLADNVPEAVRAALAAGDEGLAGWVGRELESSLPAWRLPLYHHVAASVGGLLAEARGEHEAAAARFAAAAAGWHDFGVPYEEGHAFLGRGRCLLALGRAPEAAAPLAAAREIFARLGARPALAETDAALAGIGSAGSSTEGSGS